MRILLVILCCIGFIKGWRISAIRNMLPVAPAQGRRTKHELRANVNWVDTFANSVGLEHARR